MQNERVMLEAWLPNWAENVSWYITHGTSISITSLDLAGIHKLNWTAMTSFKL
jgi:hypothetical protein